MSIETESIDDSATPTPDDEAELELTQIAAYLAELSQPGQLPEGSGDKEPVPFIADEVDFTSNAWLQRLIEVQPWLCLDQPLQAATAPDTAAVLFGEIASDPPSQCFTTAESGHLKLTALGRQHLDTWLSRAQAHRLSFEEAIEGEHSLRDASEEWRLLWEEAATGSRQAIAISAKVDKWKIKDFRDLATADLLDLNPSYQREIVWSNSDSQLLIESILRGIPLPSVILSQVEGKESHQIVDGKQRLTAILRFIGHHPDGRAFAEKAEGGLPLFEKNIRKFVAKNHLKPRDMSENFLPFKLPKYGEDDPLHTLSGKYYCEIRNLEIRIGSETVTPWRLFESPASNYVIPVIVYEKTRIQDIHHVFGLYNKQGKKLNAEELRNASYHHLELMLLLLVLSGDRPPSLAPYLPADLKERIEGVGELLTSLGFGTARFKRTKVLSWASAILLHSPNQPSPSTISTPSTASHINALLDAINEETSDHRLFQRSNLVTLARDMVDAVVMHREAVEAWHPKFRRKATREILASKWEELPLVASLIGTIILVVVQKQNLLTERMADVRKFTEANGAPLKTQNKTQWQYIARFVTGLLNLVGVSTSEADEALKKRYGYSCLPVLRQLSENRE